MRDSVHTVTHLSVHFCHIYSSLHDRHPRTSSLHAMLLSTRHGVWLEYSSLYACPLPCIFMYTYMQGSNIFLQLAPADSKFVGDLQLHTWLHGAHSCIPMHVSCCIITVYI